MHTTTSAPVARPSSLAAVPRRVLGPRRDAPPGGTPGPTIVPGPTGGATLNAGQLRLLVIERFGERWYCDPDEYPVAHGTEQERAIARFDEMVAEGEIYRAVAAKLGIDVTAAAHRRPEARDLPRLEGRAVHPVRPGR